MSTKQTLLDVLKEYKADIAEDPKAFETIWEDDDEVLPLRTLFDSAGMDPRKVSHWQALLLACACCLFPEDEDFSPKGRNVEWTDDVQDRLIEWWLEAKAAHPEEGDRRLFARMVEKLGAFEIAPRHLMRDPESLRLRFLQIKAAAIDAVAQDDARDRQRLLVEALEEYGKETESQSGYEIG